jgi:hypothetical protein
VPPKGEGQGSFAGLVPAVAFNLDLFIIHINCFFLDH